ncbi:transcription antitermination factor NusB [Ancylothrix sp. C2]|uniref:transcription antitermination factor NusB n=1 Tax=Ancylothrix sp. D3o TaxID=2953691 RepID=UPI0021BA5859|nr:transcription antitermination factor NusB [Ancylothrix sp. D3o]MCT7952054.1 transcription antitermination factor NusB [Ancylothrix sp. D3o]
MLPQQIARELALLSHSQVSSNSEKISSYQLQDLVLAAIRTLTAEINDTLETAAAELKRANDRLLTSDTRSADVDSAKVMLKEGIELTQTSINRVGMSLQLPEFIQLSNQKTVREYTLLILSKLKEHREEIDELISSSLVNWQLNRLPKIDSDILRIAVAEIQYLGQPHQVAINEAVELAKRYSGEDGYRFINGVLRRVSDQLKGVVRGA